jgi:hypothetical protein
VRLRVALYWPISARVAARRSARLLDWLTWSAPVAVSVEGDATGKRAKGARREGDRPASSANPWDWHFIRGEPVLLGPAGLGSVRRPKYPVLGGNLAGTVERAGFGTVLA